MNPPQQHAGVPKDLEQVRMTLADMNVTDYEPRCADQLLEFMHSYTVNVLKDAQVYQTHRGAANMDVEDVRLAIQSRVNNSFTEPPPRELILELAAERNQQPLDIVPKRFGVLLPPPQYCVVAPGYALGAAEPDSKSKPKKMDTSD